MINKVEITLFCDDSQQTLTEDRNFKFFGLKNRNQQNLIETSAKTVFKLESKEIKINYV